MGADDKTPHPYSPLGGGGPGGFRRAGSIGLDDYQWHGIGGAVVDLSLLSVRLAEAFIPHPGWLQPAVTTSVSIVASPAKVQTDKDGNSKIDLSRFLGKNISEICPNKSPTPMTTIAPTSFRMLSALSSG